MGTTGIHLFTLSTSISSNRTISFDLSDSLEVFPQTYNTEIVISSVSLSSPGFILIFPGYDNAQNIPSGKSTILPPGTSKNIHIPLSIQIQKGDTFFAQLHHDNGNKLFDNPIVDHPAEINTMRTKKYFFIK
jgi:hypothetical protein